MTNPGLLRVALQGYNLYYLVSMGPSIFYFDTCPALDPIDFRYDFTLPPDLKGRSIECRILLCDPNGDLVDASYDVLPPFPKTIRANLNLIPLKMISKYAQSS